MTEEITCHLERLKESFLWAAAKGGRMQEVASLLDLGAEVDWSQKQLTQFNFERDRSPLHQRADENLVHHEEESLQSSVLQDDIHLEDSPLLASVRNGHIQVASLLLAHGADPYRRTHNGDTALHLAAAIGNEDICNMFMQNNFDCCALTEVNCDGMTPFDIAVDKGFLALGENLKNICAIDRSIENDYNRDRSSGKDTEDGSSIESSLKIFHGYEGSESIIISGRIFAPRESEEELEETDRNKNEDSNKTSNCCEDEKVLMQGIKARYSVEKEAFSSDDHEKDQEQNLQILENQVKLLRTSVNKLRSQNMILKEAESAAKAVSLNTERAILTLEKKCNNLQTERDDARRRIEEILDGTDISSKSMTELEDIEIRLKKALHNVVEQKKKAVRNKLAEEEEKRNCVVCQVETKSVLLMPCRHLCVCKECSTKHELERCPLCRVHVTQKIDVYS